MEECTKGTETYTITKKRQYFHPASNPVVMDFRRTTDITLPIYLEKSLQNWRVHHWHD